jgi:hypothetical protein
MAILKSISTGLVFLLSALTLATSCNHNDPRKAFYGVWKMREIHNRQGHLHFDKPDSFITYLAHQALDAQLQGQYQGDGAYTELTAEDTAEAMAEASNMVKNVLMRFYLQFRFEAPDKVTMSVFLRSPAGEDFVESDSKTGTFEVKPEENLLILKGVNLKDSTRENRWRYSFPVPDRLRLAPADADKGGNDISELVFYKMP